MQRKLNLLTAYWYAAHWRASAMAGGMMADVWDRLARMNMQWAGMLRG